MTGPLLSLPLFLLLSHAWGSILNKDPYRIADEDGYFKREHSLFQPYQGMGMDVPFWEFGGSTVVTNQYVRLTPDRQSKRGALWNKMPTRIHNWEMLLQFRVHGSGKNLYGDGFAFWYTKEKNNEGVVFGNQDYFTGLAIFFDTYSNHQGEHAHDHPYISAMVNNGSVHYDHDRDGTHSQIAGCHAKFRNSKRDTFVAISYINRQVAVMYNFDESAAWKPCFVVSEVDLPTGYHFGFTAVTGDLCDNHDIISVRVYDVGSQMEDAKKQNVDQPTADVEHDWSTVMPKAASQEAPRAHVDAAPPMIRPFWYKLFSFGMIAVLVVGIVAVVGSVAWKQKQERNKKRFF